MKKELKDKNIVILSPSEWSDNAVSNMHIAAKLSQKNQVVYFETIGGRFPKISELGRVFLRLGNFFGLKKNNKTGRGLDPKNTKIISPIAIPIFNSIIFDFINKKLLLWQLKKVIDKYKMENIILWCFSPRWESVINEINYQVLIFHCVDGLHTYDDSSFFKNQLNRIVKKSDLVITPGILLYKNLLKIKSNVIRISHGCELNHINDDFKNNIPDDLKLSSSPRAIYVGTLANWVDYDLLFYSASQLKNISFVIIGYIHSLAPINEINKLKNLPNVFHLGYKNFKDLPSYINNSDICLVPYDQNNLHIKYSSPTKFLDYLASGVPILSSNFPDANSYEGLISIANDKIEFSDKIRITIQNNSTKNQNLRKTFAKNSTWDLQIEKMEKAIYNLI